MKSMTELAGEELCLPQRPRNQMGAARRRRKSMHQMSLHQCQSALYFTVTGWYLCSYFMSYKNTIL